jgi:hypothetical protein
LPRRVAIVICFVLGAGADRFNERVERAAFVS